MLLHVLALLVAQALPLRLVRAAFQTAGLLRHGRKDLLIVLCPFLVQISVQVFLDDAVDLQVRVSPDR